MRIATLGWSIPGGTTHYIATLGWVAGVAAAWTGPARFTESRAPLTAFSEDPTGARFSEHRTGSAFREDL